MRLLLDKCVTRYLKRDLGGHTVRTVDEAGLKGLKNGALLQAAATNFDVLVTVDQNIAHQQSLKDLPVAVLILIAKKNTYAELRPLIPKALEILKEIRPGQILTAES